MSQNPFLVTATKHIGLGDVIRYSGGQPKQGVGQENEPSGFTTYIDDDFSTDFSAWSFVGGGYNGPLGEISISGGEAIWRMGLDHTGTIAGISLATVVLSNSASAVDDTYNGMTFRATGGTASGIEREILDYDGATRTATVATWAGNLINNSLPAIPNSTTTYEIDNGGVVHSGTAQDGGTNQTITLGAGASATDDYYVQAGIYIETGTAAGFMTHIADYVGSTKVATPSMTWNTSNPNTRPDGTSTYRAGFPGGAGPDRITKTSTNFGPYEYALHEGVIVSNPFEGHPSGVNKYKYWLSGSGSNLSYLEFRGQGTGTLELGITTQNEVGLSQDVITPSDPRNTASPSAGQADIVRGVSNKIETLYFPGTGNASDGVIKVWLNGVLVLHVVDLNHDSSLIGGAGSQIGGVKYDPVWGGGRAVVPQTQTIKTSRIRVSYGSI